MSMWKKDRPKISALVAIISSPYWLRTDKGEVGFHSTLNQSEYQPLVMIWAKIFFEKRSHYFEIKIQSFRTKSLKKPTVWTDFKNSVTWLTGMKKMIFSILTFLAPVIFWSFFKDISDQKMTKAKKVTYMKNQFFHGRQSREEILNFAHALAWFSWLVSETLGGYF